MIAYPDVVQLADQLPTAEKARLIEHLSAALRRELESAPRPQEDWHEFLRSTYGSLRDTPLQRLDQGEYEEREPLE